MPGAVEEISAPFPRGIKNEICCSPVETQLIRTHSHSFRSEEMCLSVLSRLSVCSSVRGVISNSLRMSSKWNASCFYINPAHTHTSPWVTCHIYDLWSQKNFLGAVEGSKGRARKWNELALETGPVPASWQILRHLRPRTWPGDTRASLIDF